MSNNAAVVSLALPAAVTNGIAQSQSPAGAGALTLNGSYVTGGVAVLGAPARRVLVTQTAGTGVNYVIVGTDRNGRPQTDSSVTLTGSTNAYTMLDFLTVSSVTVSAAATSVTVGTTT